MFRKFQLSVSVTATYICPYTLLHLDYIHFDFGFHHQISLMHLGVNVNATLF